MLIAMRLKDWVIKKRDSKGRLLAYIYTKDKKFINAEIIKKGLVEVLITPYNIKHNRELLEAEKEAKKYGLGIWSRGLGEEGRE